MVIFQPDRVLLRLQIAELGSHIKGLTLDVGAGGYDRYSHLFHPAKCIRLDMNIHNRPDVVADAHNLPFKEEKFDSVVSTQVFGDLREPYVALRECCRVLKKGGAILLTESQTSELNDEPHDYWRFTRFAFEQLFRRCGFSMVATMQRGGFFTALAQQIIRYCIDRFDLYQHRVMGRVLNWPLKIMGRSLMLLDRLDRSMANRKHTIGWCVVARKQA
jgi:SAM-dependent methyltransferase